MQFIKNAALFVSTLLISLLLGEAAVRWVEGKPILDLENYRAKGVVRVSAAAEYDPHLGWRMKPNFVSPGHNTIEHGIRKNGTEDKLRTGGILAVGDSFTAGSEVRDNESWPAYLEQQINMPVINAASGGYGTDQIVMRIEQMLPIVQPKIVLVGMLRADIARTGYSIYNRPKPFYTIQNGNLVLHHSPVPFEPSEMAPGKLKLIAGYSAAVNRVMSIIDPLSWFAHHTKYVFASNDPIEITCHLLQRLKRKTDELGIRTLLVMQYGAPILRQMEPRPDDAQFVLECAAAMGIQPVDEFDSLSSLYKRDANAYTAYYVMRKLPSGEPQAGHMSAHGNRHVASLIAKALEQPKWDGTADGYVPMSEPAKADGVNLLAERTAAGKLIAGGAFAKWSMQGKDPSTAIYRIDAEGEKASEHYLSLNPVSAAGGVYTLTVDIKANGSPRARIQLLDPKTNGLIADVNLSAGTVSVVRLGRSVGIRGKVQRVRDGWSRVSLSAGLPEGNPRGVIQLADSKGSLHFVAGSEALQFRSVKIERGRFRQ